MDWCAIESAVGLANTPDTAVTLSYRGSSFHRAKLRNREELNASVASKRIQLLLRSHLKEIRTDAVVVEVNGQSTILPNDDVLIMIGGDPTNRFLTSIGIKVVRKDVPLPDLDEAVLG
ncbi:MAG: hypothetical protein JSV80_11595 [Acidobacteriota bacterium]|nr:MAG: hypothetical protein JSV80_11595 [Acidobacteriota bacterium]